MVPIEEVGLATGSDVLAIEPQDDRELVLAFKRGEDGSYQAIYERYRPRVRGICIRMLNHNHDAEEAQQETFMRVYTSLPKFNGRYQLGAWVSRIATNVCLDHIRSRVRKPADCATHEMLVDLAVGPEENGPEEELLKGDERNRVRVVLAKLAPNHRAALALREFEGMSYGDIAIALNMTEPQVKALIHRARKAFKKQWAPGLAALLPWRLIARFRKFSSHYDGPPQITDAAASSVQFATSCSVALQQCGQFVSERVATTVTALVVGTAAVGVAIAPAGDAGIKGPVPHERLAVVVSGEETDGPLTQPRAKPKVQPAATAAEEPQAPTPASDPEPEPTTEPTTAPSEPETVPPTEEKSDDAPKVPAGPAPVYTYFGWEDDQAIPRAQASSSSSVVDCTKSSAIQEVQTLISYGAFSYPLSLRFDVSATTARLAFTVDKDGRDIDYASWGAEPIATWTRAGSDTRVEITGDYGALYGSDPEYAKLPKSGSFHATLTLDCAAQTVITEGAAFTAE